MDVQMIRGVLMETVEELLRVHDNTLSQLQVLGRVSKRLGIGGPSPQMKEEQRALLTVWYDLFLEGIMSWGADIDNPNPPFCHLTERGRRALARKSRDPWNHDGYLAYLTGKAVINPVARSYIEEALRTYRATCYKAAAVMVGAATESVVLDVRDALVARLAASGVTFAPSGKERQGLDSWKIKAVLDQLQQVLDRCKGAMPRELLEEYTSYWSGISHHARFARNDAGHPSSPDPVREETVHAALLLFPVHAELAIRLVGWIPKGIA